MKPQRTWILIADGIRARILLNDGPGRGVRQLPNCEFTAPNQSDGEIDADRPGRTFDSAGSGRHAFEPHSSPKRDAKHDFARQIIARLVREYNDGNFDRLIVVASPQMLGDLRSLFPNGLKASVIGELAKDLTHLSTDKIGLHLTDLLAV